MKCLIVGAGLSGLTAAQILKSKGHDVEVFESRKHIGGNCYDKEINGIQTHMYGPHGFHTNNKSVWNFLKRYSSFNNVCLKVKANTSEGIIPIPFNKESEKKLGLKTPNEIIDLVFKDYSEKMWGVPWESLPASISQRVPKVRQDDNPCYHLDKYQGIPTKGYTEMFLAMAEGVRIHYGTTPRDWKKYNFDLLVYTGKIDEYFDSRYGNLEYRSLLIQFETAKQRPDIFQLNECNKKAYTRSVDHSHWHQQKVEETIISREYPCEHDETNVPFYPKPFGNNLEKYALYKKLSKTHNNVIFTGRLATYKYLDMDDAVAQCFRKLNYDSM